MPEPAALPIDHVEQRRAALALATRWMPPLSSTWNSSCFAFCSVTRSGDLELAQRLERRLGDRLVGGVGDRRGDLVFAAFALDDGGGAGLRHLDGLDVGRGSRSGTGAAGPWRFRPFRAAVSTTSAIRPRTANVAREIRVFRFMVSFESAEG